MSCGGCGNKPKPIFPGQVQSKPNFGGVIKNLAKAAIENPDVFRWFRDGITGIVKCLTGTTLYSDNDIIKNRDICRNCPHSTKTEDKLTNKSQCMAPDPEKNNAPCGCFIVCKTQTGKCPLEKWTHLTINKLENKTEKLYHNDSIETSI